MFVALYMPTCNHRRDPTIAGFATEKCAQEYVYDQMCKTCKLERQMALSGKKEIKKWKKMHDGWEPSVHPGCACEWEIIPYENFTAIELENILSKQVENETVHKTV